MKKITALFSVFALLLTLSACNNTPSELPSESSTDGSSSVTSTTESTAESTSEVSTTSGAPVTSTQISTDDISDAPTEKAPEVPIPDDFDICDYITDFDDVELIGCSYVEDPSIPLADETAFAKAVEAYMNSEMYSEALERAKEMYHFENGELTENDDSEGWIKDGYKRYIVQSETSELTFQPDIVASAKYKHDGENEESIVLLRVPLPESKSDWSGHANFHIPVYINADGEAHILYDACRQDYGTTKLLSYTDGSVQVLFNFGHNESGQRSAIYSFKDGKPKLELAGYPVSVYDGMIMGGYGWRFFEPFLYDKENGEFCGIAAVAPSRELAEIICSDKTVLSYVPDAWEMYQKDRIQIIGGKYITFTTGIPWNDNTFTYNSADKCFERVEPVAVTDSLPEQITKSYNVKL